MEEKKLNLKEKLQKIQFELKAPKDLRNNFGNYNYRNAESILEAFKPYGDKYKVYLEITDEIVLIGERYYVKATASLYDCNSMETISVSAYAREEENKKGMDSAQLTGATSSYARKYALNGLLLLDDTKDQDSNEYAKETQTRAKYVPKEPVKATPKPSGKITQAQKEKLYELCNQEVLQKYMEHFGIGNIDDFTSEQAGMIISQRSK